MRINAVDSLGEADGVQPCDLMAEVVAARYLMRVYRFAVMISPRGADAEDLAQIAILKAVEHADGFDARRGTLDAWLWRIVVNVARDAGRAARRAEFLVERLADVRDGSAPAAASPETLALDRLRDRELIQAVRALPRRYRTLIALRYGAGLSTSEIAELLGTTRMAVAKATRRALDKLRTDLKGMEI